MKLWKISSYLTLALLAPCLLFSGCGGGSNGAVVTTVSVISSQGNNLILGQSANLTATVVGPTNTNVTWVGCTFTIIPATPVGNTTPSTAAPCPKDPNHSPSDPNFTIFGSLTNEQATGSATFTATSTLPDPTKFPSLVVIITVQAVGDSSKHGTDRKSVV